MNSITYNQRTVVKKAAQLGFTEILLNVIGYHIDQDPAPILVVQPNKEPMAKDFSSDRLAPMIRDTPCLRRKVAVEKSRDSKNTLLNKTFSGGNVSVTGAESPTGMRSKPKRIVLFDETDAYTRNSGNEGDPLGLGAKRAANFWNRRMVYISTPTVKGRSRIDELWELSDKRFYHLPCPRCGAAHVLRWGQVKWDADSPAEGNPSKAVFQCPECSGYYTNSEKNQAVKHAERILGHDPWIPSVPAVSPSPSNPTGIAGFQVSELYSSWRSISEITNDFIAAKDSPEQLQVFINTVLGEVWEEGKSDVDKHTLLSRCSVWEHRVPEKVLIITAGADVQADRIEMEVVGWGAGEESWSIDYRVFHGNPDIPEGIEGSPWNAFMEYHRSKWEHPKYGPRAIEWTCIDTGGTGTNTTSVYQFVRRHRGERIFGVKGRGGDGVPVVSRPTTKGVGKKARFDIDLFTVGTDLAKSIIYRRLKMDDHGPGFCHFPEGRDLKYFEMLTSEREVITYKNGFAHRTFEKEKSRRNEALDCRVYAYAALHLAGVKWDKLALKLSNLSAELTRTYQLDATKVHKPAVQEPAKEEQPAHDPEQDGGDSLRKPLKRRRVRRGNFLNSWRGL